MFVDLLIPATHMKLTNSFSDVLSSSVEGSYELGSNEKSPILTSTQETIAETVSEFKLDEPVAGTVSLIKFCIHLFFVV